MTAFSAATALLRPSSLERLSAICCDLAAASSCISFDADSPISPRPSELLRVGSTGANNVVIEWSGGREEGWAAAPWWWRADSRRDEEDEEVKGGACWSGEGEADRERC